MTKETTTTPSPTTHQRAGRKTTSLLSSPLHLDHDHDSSTTTPKPVETTTTTSTTTTTATRQGEVPDNSPVFVQKHLMSSPLFPATDEEDEDVGVNHQVVEGENEKEEEEERGEGGMVLANNDNNNNNLDDGALWISPQHDLLLQQVSTWIQDLTVLHENLQRTSVQNAIVLDSLHMTGALRLED